MREGNERERGQRERTQGEREGGRGQRETAISFYSPFDVWWLVNSQQQVDQI